MCHMQDNSKYVIVDIAANNPHGLQTLKCKMLQAARSSR